MPSIDEQKRLNDLLKLEDLKYFELIEQHRKKFEDARQQHARDHSHTTKTKYIYG
jgi:hypothetical protein